MSKCNDHFLTVNYRVDISGQGWSYHPGNYGENGEPTGNGIENIDGVQIDVLRYDKSKIPIVYGILSDNNTWVYSYNSTDGKISVQGGVHGFYISSNEVCFRWQLEWPWGWSEAYVNDTWTWSNSSIKRFKISIDIIATMSLLIEKTRGLEKRLAALEDKIKSV